MIPKTPKLNKIIEAKQIFADFAFKDARERRFGLTPCCKGDVEKYTNVNEICDWEGLVEKINKGDTYTFTTWDRLLWAQYGTYPPNPQTIPSWAQRYVEEYPPYFADLSRIVTEGPRYSHTANTTAGTDMSFTIPATQLDNILANYMNSPNPANNLIVRGTSRIYIFVMKHFSTIASQEFIDYYNGGNPFNIKVGEVDDYIVPTNHTLCVRTGCAEFENTGVMMIEWLNVMNYTDTLVPASGDFSVNLRQNTNTDGEKNGADPGDSMWFVVDTKGDGTNLNWVFLNDDAGPGNIFDITTPQPFVSGGSLTMTFPMLADVRTGWDPNDWYLIFARLNQIERKIQFSGMGYNAGEDWWISLADCDGTETVVVSVKDSLGNIVTNYPISIDNSIVGKTNKYGMFVYKIPNAETVTNHIIDECKCFTTTGKCNQQKIDIVLAKTVKPSCTNLAIDCL